MEAATSETYYDTANCRGVDRIQSKVNPRCAYRDGIIAGHTELDGRSTSAKIHVVICGGSTIVSVAQEDTVDVLLIAAHVEDGASMVVVELFGVGDVESAASIFLGSDFVVVGVICWCELVAGQDCG